MNEVLEAIGYPIKEESRKWKVHAKPVKKFNVERAI